jgi:hypothetical protein
MDLVVAAVLALAGVVGAVLFRVLSDEVKAWNPWIVDRLITLAERKLPEEYRARLSEEWRSHVDEIPGDLGKLFTACGFLIASRKLRGAAVNSPYVLVFVGLAIAFLLPMYIVVTISLMVEQKEWPFVRVKGKFWGQQVTVWDFRTLDDPAYTVSYLVNAFALSHLPIFFSVLSGKVRFPLRRLIQILTQKNPPS